MAVDSGTSSPYGRVPFLSACFLSSLFFLSLSLAISLPLSLSSLLLRSARSDRVSIALRLLVPSSEQFFVISSRGEEKGGGGQEGGAGGEEIEEEERQEETFSVLCEENSACVPLRVHREYEDWGGSLAEKERWLAGWGTREIDSVVATTFHTDPVYLASSYEAGVGTRLGNRGRSRSRFPARLLARKLGGESDRIVFRGKTFFKGFFGREGEGIWVEDRENHVSRVILRSELLDDLREHVCEVSVRGVKGERSEGRVFVRIDFIWWSATFFFFGFAWNNWLTGWWPGGMVF